MNKKHIITIFLLILSCISSFGSEKNNKFIKGFSGGMMVHTGYLQGGDIPAGELLNIGKFNPKGATFGIGGVAKLHLTDHFRAGFEGYFSNMGLSKNIQDGSFNKLFWTGALADWYWKAGRFYPYVGITLGGGMETAFYIFDGDKNDWLPEAYAVYNKKPFFAADPFIGVEYALGEALHLTLKADWLLAINNDGLNRPMGPRFYFGFIFAH